MMEPKFTLRRLVEIREALTFPPGTALLADGALLVKHSDGTWWRGFVEGNKFMFESSEVTESWLFNEYPGTIEFLDETYEVE